MPPIGFQDAWVTGSRLYFKRDDDAAGNKFPRIDLGIIEVANPNIQASSVELQDSDGGVRRLVDKRVTDISETYDIVCSNMSPKNLALLFLSNAPAAVAQTQVEKAAVSQRAHPGELLGLVDTDGSTRLFPLDAVGGLYTGAVSTKVLESIDVATRTLKLTGDQTAVAGLAPGKAIIVQKAGLTNVKNSRTYTIVSRTLNAGKTDLVVNADPAGNESAIAGQITHENGGTVYKQDVDWELVSLDRGYVRIITGGAISTEQDILAIFITAALTGNRLVNPQSLKGAFTGTAEVWYGRENNAYQSVRECKVSMSPKGASFSDKDFSKFTLEISVLNDLSKTTPAGRLLSVKGNLPSVS